MNIKEIFGTIFGDTVESKKEMNMSLLDTEVYGCLRMFGPCNAWVVRAKIGMRGNTPSYNDVLSSLESLESRGAIQAATGMGICAYKVREV